MILIPGNYVSSNKIENILRKNENRLSSYFLFGEEHSVEFLSSIQIILQYNHEYVLGCSKFIPLSSKILEVFFFALTEI